jgi:mannose-1-phosphate guanylyltransferase/mannose-1-phosphate guanylyltransferase/mannose-6-phosphate isomerase
MVKSGDRFQQDRHLKVIHPVILCGGSGTRLWPVSRKAYPKQFAALVSDLSLYQMTLRRFAAKGFAAPIVVTGDSFRFLATEQAQAVGLGDARVVVEPQGRDTAPAILTAALLLENEPDAQMLIAPSDHVIGDVPGFLEAVACGSDAAHEGAFVTFGVTPDRPETGYGYLELSAAPVGGGPVTLKSFREKPDRATAEAMLTQGGYLWNSGIFMIGVADLIDAFETHAPEMVAPCRQAIAEGAQDLGFFRLAEAPYASITPISFDYAIMEKVDRVMAVPLPGLWSDLGAWDALWQQGDKDGDGVVRQGPVTALDCHDSYLRSEGGGLHLVGLGLDGIVAVAMRDAVLVADKSRAQEVKQVVETLRAAGAAQADDMPRFYRPWGWYETLCLGTRFQVKRIMVKPGGVLSLQSHMHRSEHWIVVSGTAEVTVGESVRLVTENEGVYIPLGEKHRMANRGKVPMYLIEVQTGAYLGEDDIQRYEDIYNRA